MFNTYLMYMQNLFSGVLSFLLSVLFLP